MNVLLFLLERFWVTNYLMNKFKQKGWNSALNMPFLTITRFAVWDVLYPVLTAFVVQGSNITREIYHLFYKIKNNQLNYNCTLSEIQNTRLLICLTKN